jgi:hypothetical protein
MQKSKPAESADSSTRRTLKRIIMDIEPAIHHEKTGAPRYLDPSDLLRRRAG